MQPEILYRLRFISNLTEGPGNKPLFVLTDIERPEGDKEPPKYRPRLALWDGGLRLLTQGEARNPQWRGEYYYFTRKVDKANQLFRMPVGGGEPEQLTRFKGGANSYKVSPDGSRIALLSPGDREPPKPDQPQSFASWPFKFEQRGLLQDTPAAVWLWEQGQLRQLHQPTLEVTEMAWSPDGQQLYFVSYGSLQERLEGKQRVYALDLQGRVRELFGGEGPVSGLEPAPDGSGLVYLAHAYERGSATDARLTYRPFGGEPRVLAQGNFTNTINSDCRYGTYAQTPKFGPDGLVYVVETKEGHARLRKVSLEGEVSKVHGIGESVLAFALCGRDLYVLTETATQPARLGRPGETLFDPNAEVPLTFPEPAPVAYRAPEGHTVPGWVLLPEGEGPHPLILYIHGGPHTAFGSAPMLAHHLFREAGFAVAYCNPRGSSSYGEAFADLGYQWGEIDQADLLGFLDAVLERFPQLDRARVGVAGGSYGGYMTNWLTARVPERFKAAVTDRSICNWTSFFGASDIGPRFVQLQLGASVWDRPEVLWAKSPLSLVHQVKAPTLVVHSEQDHRCPIDQGETWYTALLHRGVPTRFFRVPEEGHELSRSGRPDRRVARLEAYLEWWRQHL